MIKIVLVISVLLSFVASANAELIDNGDGSITQIRDDGSVLMWNNDAQLSAKSGYCDTYGNCSLGIGVMHEDHAAAWIDHLNATLYLGYSDWRLPEGLNRDGSGPCSGYNCTESELGYLYYTELGNTAESETYNWGAFVEPTPPAPGFLADNASSFYFDPVTGGGGKQQLDDGGGYVLAVRDVGVVPEPVSSTLFLIGGATLGFRRLRKK